MVSVAVADPNGQIKFSETAPEDLVVRCVRVLVLGKQDREAERHLSQIGVPSELLSTWAAQGVQSFFAFDGGAVALDHLDCAA